MALVSDEKKAVSSREGMNRTQETSPLFSGWVESGPEDVIEAEQAVRERDLERLGTVMEHSTMNMVGTMFSAQPAVIYMKPATVAVLHAVSDLRSRGVGAWATMDAGPNVKVLTTLRMPIRSRPRCGSTSRPSTHSSRRPRSPRMNLVHA